ncbi:MAG TPA: hypothetical protein VHF89_21225 [Solirubrobacteraceae bacterium]|nr:hypothetical protein [Solirubrobacteraceae bacterium]
MSERGPLDFDDDRREEPAREPPPPPPPPAPPPGASRYTWFIGVVFILAVAGVILWGSTTREVPTGELAPFAVPLADAAPRPREDANVNPERACDVRGDWILNICEQYEQGPVVLALFPTDAGRCRRVLDQFERLRPRFPDVRFVAVGSAGDRDNLKGRAPLLVGWDKDRAVASYYRLVGCPQIIFAEKGGDVVDTTYRELSDGAIAGKVRELR